MAKTYLAVWRQFNGFLLRLEQILKTWEERVLWFCAFLIDKGGKSTTIKSYVSALKTTLTVDGYIWIEDRVKTANQCCWV